MSARSARNSLLAAGAAIGVGAGVLQVVSASLSLADYLKFPAFTSLKVASGFELLGWVLALAAFAAALAAFLITSRRSRTTVLAVSAGLFVGYGVSILTADLIQLIQQWGFGFQPWEFKAAGITAAAAATALTIAALLVAIGVVAIPPDGLLGAGSVVLALDFALVCTSYSFELAGFHHFIPIPARVSWGLGTTAGGNLVVAAGALLAGIAFLTSNVRRERDAPWQAQREGSLETAAVVFAVGFLFVSVGLMLLASEAGGGRSVAEDWLRAVAQLLLAFAAVCGAVGFVRSRRDADQRLAAAAQAEAAAAD